MLLGQVNNKLDDKNRLSFPKKFRKELGSRLIITANMEGSLLVVSATRFNTLLEGTENKPFIDKSVREVQRFLLGMAEEVGLDEKGRFILPAHLKDYSGISQEAVFVGLNNRVEIWSKTRWDEYNTKHLKRNIAEIAQKLSDESK
jgi:MraZ protein